MIRSHLGRRLALAVAILCPLSNGVAIAGDTQDVYYQAYFLEHEKGDFAAKQDRSPWNVSLRNDDAQVPTENHCISARFRFFKHL